MDGRWTLDDACKLVNFSQKSNVIRSKRFNRVRAIRRDTITVNLIINWQVNYSSLLKNYIFYLRSKYLEIGKVVQVYISCQIPNENTRNHVSLRAIYSVIIYKMSYLLWLGISFQMHGNNDYSLHGHQTYKIQWYHHYNVLNFDLFGN